MDISIFGYKLNLEILILIGVIYLILIGHTLCGCSRVGLMEGLEMMAPNISADTAAKTKIAEEKAKLAADAAQKAKDAADAAQKAKLNFDLNYESYIADQKAKLTLSPAPLSVSSESADFVKQAMEIMGVGPNNPNGAQIEARLLQIPSKERETFLKNLAEGKAQREADEKAQAIRQEAADKARAKASLPVSSTKKEGFTGANINYGESSAFDLSLDYPVDTSSWSAQNMTVVPGQPLSAGVKIFLARKPQQIPLPEGEMDFFANSQFKPECCPSTYSTSEGCWCGTSQDFNYLVTRGSNNVPYSEY